MICSPLLILRVSYCRSPEVFEASVTTAVEVQIHALHVCIQVRRCENGASE